MCTGEEAVSEAIGFILIFSLVIIGIGLVTMYGYPVLLKQQASADERIMEKNMIVLQNDLKGLCYKTVPYKETSLKVGGGTLNVINQSLARDNFRIEVNNAIIEDPHIPFKPGELKYETLDQNLVTTIENGAVIYRQYGATGSTMLAEPRWFIDYDPITDMTTIVIYLIGIDSTEMMGETGVSTVQMALNQTTFLERQLNTNDIVTVKYTPDPNNDYSVAWSNYLTRTLKYTDAGGGKYDYTVTSLQGGTLVIKYYDVIIKGI
jgi:hypothetical protein